MKSLLLFAVFFQLALTKATSYYKSEVPSQSATGSLYEQTIQVRKSSEGTGCTDLNDTLTNAFQSNKHNRSLEIKLGEGCFSLSSSELATFTGWTDFAIIGTDRNSSMISCSEGVGLTFLSSVGITFRNLTITGCGGKQTSTSKNMTSNSGRISYLEVWVGVYFLSCGNVYMYNVEIRESKGVGVVMYNCYGTNTFNHTIFYGNLYHDRSGGMAIEFTFCQPGDANCKDGETSSVQVSQSHYTFFQCIFNANGVQSEYKYYNGSIVPYPHGTEHVAFGKGGGLSIIFKGNSSQNSIVIYSCTFKFNSAQWGGGLYTSFGDQSINNKITVAKSKFFLNINYCTGNSPKWMKSGGGAQIDFIYYPTDDELWPGYQPKVVGNSVSFNDTYFASNVACWGGAVSIIVSRESPGHSVSNSILFDKCHFKYNQANIASAVDVSIFQPDLLTSNGTLMKPVFKNCQFIQNSFNRNTNGITFQAVRGILYANLVPLTFTGVTTFSDNFGTALTVSGTYVSLSESSEIIFERNSGRHGGALAFIGNSWLVVHKNAHVSFINNSADMLGGAVYSVHFGEHDLMYKWNCFFQYYKAAQSPSEWNATFKFSGNHANNRPNSIYTTSLLPCVWPSGPTLVSDLVSANVFCRHPWIFDTDCSTEIGTGPSSIIIRSEDICISAVPGWKTPFNATTMNDFGIEIPNVFTTVPYYQGSKQADIEVNNSTAYIADNNLVVLGVENRSARLLLQTLDPKVISRMVEINTKNCSFGYKPQNCTMPGREHMVCDCICTNHIPGVACDSVSHSIKVYVGSCLTYWYDGLKVDTSRPAVVGRCPYVSEDTEFPYNVSYNSSELNHKVCGGSRRLNRAGLLCSQCMDGLGVDVNDYRFPCVECHAHYSWFLYILAELIPVVFFFFIMAFFNISATSAPMNAFVFFSQIVTIPYFHNPYSFMFGYSTYPPYYADILEALVAFPYAIWNLDFFATAAVPGFCLHKELGTLEVIALKYLNAFLPLVLIIACYILIQLYDRNYRVVRILWYPFQKCSKKIYKNREPKTSIVDVIATFLLLSYNKVLYVSFSLFAFMKVHEVDSNQVIGDLVFYFDASTPLFHGKYAFLSITAFIIFLLFLALPPLFFFLYPLKYSQKLIDKFPFKFALRTFADTFTGGFRDGTFKDGSSGDKDCRRFAGYYFLFRVVVFLILVSELSWLKQYFIQQVLCTICIFFFACVKPYKENFYNNLDTAMFTLLAILNSFSLYNSQTYYFVNDINQAVFWINYLLIFLPLLYIVWYVVYLILLWKGCLKRWTKPDLARTESIAALVGDSDSINGEEREDRVLLVAHDSRDPGGDIPDRLVNPQNYNSRNLYKPLCENVASSSDPDHPNQQRANLQGSSEKSYFIRKRDRMLVPYGTLSESFPTQRHSEPPLMRRGKTSGGGAGTSGLGSSSGGKRSTGNNSAGSKPASVHFQGVV